MKYLLTTPLRTYFRLAIRPGFASFDTAANNLNQKARRHSLELCRNESFCFFLFLVSLYLRSETLFMWLFVNDAFYLRRMGFFINFNLKNPGEIIYFCGIKSSNCNIIISVHKSHGQFKKVTCYVDSCNCNIGEWFYLLVMK